jgi:hypothetical protein
MPRSAQDLQNFVIWLKLVIDAGYESVMPDYEP